MLWYFVKHFWQIMKFVFWDKKYMTQELKSKLIKITDEISYLDASEDPISSNVVFIKPKNSQTTWIFDVGLTSLAAQEINAVQGKKIVVISHFHPDHLFNINRISYDELYLSAHTFKYAKKGTVVKNMEFSVENSRLSENCSVQVADLHLSEDCSLQLENFKSTENQLAQEGGATASFAKSSANFLEQTASVAENRPANRMAQVENSCLTEDDLEQVENFKSTENQLAQGAENHQTDAFLNEVQNQSAETPQKTQNPKIKIMELPSSHAKGSLMLQYGDYVFTGDGTYCTSKNGEHVYNANLLFDEIQTLEKLDCKYLCLSHDKNFVQKKESVLSLHKNIYSRRKSNEAYISVEDFFDSKGNVIK